MYITSRKAVAGRSKSWLAFGVALLLGTRYSSAITLNIDDSESVKSAAATAAYGLMSWYNGNDTGGTPGNLPAPYYWWEAGAMMMSMIDYWYYTGDSQYNNLTAEGILWQVGPDWDFMTPNQTKTTGNDDQAFWGFAAMEAAELNFPNPPADGPQWLALAQAVFNLQTTRWDTSTCGGGLKWQVYPFNIGYDYKNGISNGCFFNLASRLYRYTGNQTYADWAVKMWDWVEAVGIVGDNYEVYDGTNDLINCTQMNHNRWTYNSGVFLHGAANMWNMTSDPVWQTRVNGFLTASEFFFQNNVMYEAFCEPIGNCNNDMQSFKAYLSRWMAATTLLAPWTTDTVMPYLRASAIAAAEQCSGGDTGEVCGLEWTKGTTWDGIYGPGEQMAAMQVIASNLIGNSYAPYTNTTGGTSVGNPSAGSSGDASESSVLGTHTITSKDKAGAWIVTSVVLLTVLCGAVWMII